MKIFSSNRIGRVWVWLISVGAFGNQVQAAPLRFLSPPVITNLQALPNTVLRFSTVGESELFYSVQSSTNLTTWMTSAFEYSSSGQVPFVDAGMPNSPFRFYRAKVNHPNSAVYTNYHGWSNAIILNNGSVEAVIVPTVGRVMQFRFLGGEGPFWENTNRYGKFPSPDDWNRYPGSFGGDKSWPAPQAAWNWPPPSGFDGMTNVAFITNGIVTMVGPVDSTYQTRPVRRIELGFDEPVLRIVTSFERASSSAKTNKVSVWVITQLQHPVRCYVPLARPSLFPQGYLLQSATAPKDIAITNNLLSFVRDPLAAHKIGADSGTMLWVGTNVALRIDSARSPGIPSNGYPDNGSSVEVYTNPDSPAYVEFETLGPLEALLPGDRISRTNTYRLYRRTEATPDLEARRILGF